MFTEPNSTRTQMQENEKNPNRTRTLRTENLVPEVNARHLIYATPSPGWGPRGMAPAKITGLFMFKKSKKTKNGNPV